MEFPRNTRLESKMKNADPSEFLKARPSNTPYPINSYEPTYNDRNFVNSRNQQIEPVQLNNDPNRQFNYFMNNFQTLNSNQNNDTFFMEHQPINTRYTQYNNDRKQELNEFRSIQTPQYEDRVPVNTRKDKNTINTNTYIPNSKILAIPKENI